MFGPLINFITQKGLATLLVVLFAGTTVATSGAAGVKLYQSVSRSQQASAIELPGAPPTPTPIVTTSAAGPSTGPTIKPSSTKPSPFPPAPTPTVKVQTLASNPTSNACIVTLFGQQYDVTTLRSTHSGGDIFKCGTDMTAVYQNRHGTNLSRMQPYLISPAATSTNPTGSIGSTITPTPGPSYHEEDDSDHDESEAEQERYLEPIEIHPTEMPENDH